jgi:hypothetical protein
MATWADKVTSLRAVLFQEGDSWSAQCLDFDIVAQAETLWALPTELARVLAVHVAASAQLGREPFAGIEAAPLRFWNLYEGANRYEVKLPSFVTDDASIQLPQIDPDLRIAQSPAMA